MDQTQQENRIMALEKQVKQLNDILSSVMQNSNATKIYFKNQVQFDAQSLVGFYGKDPVKKQSLASDTLANLLTALRTLGLIT